MTDSVLVEEARNLLNNPPVTVIISTRNRSAVLANHHVKAVTLLQTSHYDGDKGSELCHRN